MPRMWRRLQSYTVHVRKGKDKNFSNLLETDLTEAVHTQSTKNTVTTLFEDTVWA